MVTQLIYMSQPFGYDGAMLAGILSTARRNNPRDAITGALICRQDIYLQLLEGDGAAIDALYQRIAFDDRHLAVTVLSRMEVSDRLFSQWAMLHDPARSWLWSVDEVARGAVQDAGPLAVQHVFARVAREVKQRDLTG